MATGVKIAFVLLGLLLVGGLVGREAWNYDPKAYPYSRDQVQAMLVDAKTTLPRRDGDGKIQIWSAGRSAKGVKLNMKYASYGAPAGVRGRRHGDQSQGKPRRRRLRHKPRQ